MRCQRPDGTHYGTNGKCRIGIQDEEREWLNRQSERWPQHRKALEKLAERVSDLPEKERKALNEALSVQLNSDNLRKNWEGEDGQKVVGKGGREYTEEEKAKAMGRQINGWNRLIDSGPPTEVVLRNNQKVDSPAKMVPEVKQSSGQAGYREIVDGKPGTKFSITDVPGVYSQNRASKADSNRVIHSIGDFRKAQTQAKKPWPAQELEPRKDIDLDAEKIWSGLSKQEKLTIGTTGLPKDGGAGEPGAEVFRFLTKPENKHLIEERAREIVERYVSQGGRSGVSGLPIGLPGLKVDSSKGEEKSTVDHFNPISNSKGMTVKEIRQMFDHKGNFLLAEEGPNQARQENDWGDWVNKKLKATPKPDPVSTAPKKPKTSRQPLTADQKGVLSMYEKRIKKQAKEMEISEEKVKGDEDFLRLALGSKMGAWKQLSSLA